MARTKRTETAETLRVSPGSTSGAMTQGHHSSLGHHEARLTALITALSEAVTMFASMPTPQ
jgi:hypothetical protein